MDSTAIAQAEEQMRRNKELGLVQEPIKQAAPVQLTAAQIRSQDRDAGQDAARRELYDDPTMQAIADRRADLAKGYSGQTLGALRDVQNREIAGQRQGYLAQLQGRAARSGIGGARAAAMGAAADRGFLKEKASAEAQQALMQEDAIRKGQQAQDEFELNRKYGVLGAGLAEAGLGAQERSGTKAAAAANREPNRGFLGNLFGGLF